MWRTLAFALAMAALLPTLLLGQGQGQGERKNLQVFRDVAREINRYPRFTVFDDVGVKVDRGVVTLTGKVTKPYKAQDLVRAVSKVRGVVSVRNEIKVLPVSLSDDALRYKIARGIYSNPGFWQYAAMANPPIHILVERGHVTLVGVVNNNVERMLAQSIAASSSAFSVTNRLKTDAEMRAELETMDRSSN